MCRGLAALPSTCIERAKEMRVQLGSLLHKPKAISEPESVAVKQQKLPWTSRPSTEEALGGGQVFDKLLSNKSGVTTFRAFLCSEFSEENLEFWLACEDYKKTKSPAKRASKAKKIYSEFIETDAAKEVNVDFHTKEVTKKSISQPTLSCFDSAQKTVYNLMEKDSYPRFLRSELYLKLLKQVQFGSLAPRQRSQSFTSSTSLLETQTDFTIWL
uniref:Regulator of G-protein signaling 5-like protein n=1 Tax=Callorhinchus milii TaxID=7868 RepID=V9L4P1_CALMI